MATDGAYDQREALLAATSTLKVPEPGTTNRNLLPGGTIRVMAATTLVEDLIKAIQQQLPQPCTGKWEDHHPGHLKCSECNRLLNVDYLQPAELRTVLATLQGTDHYRWP